MSKLQILQLPIEVKERLAGVSEAFLVIFWSKILSIRTEHPS